MKSTNFSAGWQGSWERFQEVKHLPATKCNSSSVMLCHHVVSHIGPTTVIGEVSKLTGVNCGYCFYIVREESAKDLQALLNLVRKWLCYMAGALYGGLRWTDAYIIYGSVIVNTLAFLIKSVKIFVYREVDVHINKWCFIFLVLCKNIHIQTGTRKY